MYNDCKKCCVNAMPYIIIVLGESVCMCIYVGIFVYVIDRYIIFCCTYVIRLQNQCARLLTQSPRKEHITRFNFFSTLAQNAG